MEKIINERFQLLKGKKVLIACSTGVDSMVLLDLAIKHLGKENVGIIHIHHHKREQSDVEKTFIETYATTNNIPFYFKKLEKYSGNNFQAWAREKRYDFFKEIYNKYNYDYVLLAHHMDDNFETIIMRLLRSSSLKGYAGIELFTDYKGIKIYRPLLNLSKEEIKNYALTNHITYFEDDSNNHDDYERNRIRHQIIPILKQENPNWKYAIENYHNTLINANNIIEKEIKNFNEKIKEKHFLNHLIKEFNDQDFKQLDPYLQEQIIFRILKQENLSKRTIKELLKQLTKKEKLINQISDYTIIIKEYEKIKIIYQKIEQPDINLTINKDGVYQLMNNCKLTVNNNICEFVIDEYKEKYIIEKLPITIRTKKIGDKINLKTGTISISDFLTNHKVPYINRQYTMILENENKEIIRIFYKKEEDINGW